MAKKPAKKKAGKAAEMKAILPAELIASVQAEAGPTQGEIDTATRDVAVSAALAVRSAEKEYAESILAKALPIREKLLVDSWFSGQSGQIQVEISQCVARAL